MGGDKLTELKNIPTDPNSIESQKFLRNLREKILAHQAKMKKMIKAWEEEDRQNEGK